MSRPLSAALAATLLFLLCGCPAEGGGDGPITEVPIGGCETDPFAGTCVAQFVQGDACWDAAGMCHGSLFSDVYWDNGASIHSNIAPDFSAVELEFYGTMDRCFTGSSPLDIDAPDQSFTGSYTRDSDGARLRWRSDDESIVYTCPDGRRVRALFEQGDCVYGDGSQQCRLDELDALSTR